MTKMKGGGQDKNRLVDIAQMGEGKAYKYIRTRWLDVREETIGCGLQNTGPSSRKH